MPGGGKKPLVFQNVLSVSSILLGAQPVNKDRGVVDVTGYGRGGSMYLHVHVFVLFMSLSLCNKNKVEAVEEMKLTAPL